jgi:FAD/FMN-containing dehydrogenase
LFAFRSSKNPTLRFFQNQKHYLGTSSIVLRPQTTQEVSSILQYCHENYLGVVPQAGNTGLVGGSIPIGSNEVIVSVERMNRITSWNPTTGILTGQAGGILQDWQDYAQQHNVIIPVDLGSKGSCCIGGNISTNAGGQYYARYKSLHANVVGLEVVVAGGQILRFNLNETTDGHHNKVLCNLKDNTGYDMKHLFIGAEGTLGIITQVALWCSSPFPVSRCAVLCACTSLEQVQECLQLARKELGETLAAFEFMDDSVTELVASNQTILSNAAAMIPKQESSFFPYYILVETHGTNPQHDEEKMQSFLEKSLEGEFVLDGVLAQDLSQVQALWKIRESCNPTVASHGYTYKYDVSLPFEQFAPFAQDMKGRLLAVNEDIVTTNWGHIMDGNLHFNVTTPGTFHVDPKVLGVLEPYIFESVIQRGGSISAEHGLGQSKNKYLPMVHDPVTLALMKSIKQLLDPHGIMNPGKYLPNDEP